ncbi:MAG TPA: ATP-binding protein [Verrucomicrobiae bacterium]|nr:ATP-binding protein [Verrucomicrobiae bacterium]
MKSDLSFQLESAAWPAFVVEAGGTIRHANQAAIAFFGPKLEGEGLLLSALWAEQGETVEQFLARWERSAAATIPLRYHGKGGSVSTFATYICAARDVQKRYIFQLIRSGDMSSAAISDLSRLGVPEGKPAPGETAIFQKQKLDCATQLTRSVALDFNNVLTGILGHSSLVLSQMESAHPFRTSILEIEKAAARAAEIAQQLAAFSRAEKESPAHANGNLNSVIRRLTEGFQKTRPSTLRWQLQLEEHLYSVKFDESKVQQALAKIIENSLDATEPTGRISVATRNLDITEATQDRTAQLVPGTYVCITVSDDGKGINPEAMTRIFEPFYSTKFGHRGLGLAWVYGIITNHRGGVAISSEPGQGTSVRIYLPATQEIVTDTTLLRCDFDKRRTILMVDDEDLVLTMGKMVLSTFGYEVLTATSGEKALQLLSDTIASIDLVITDIVMPQMSGREFIDQLELRLPGVPILRTSGYLRSGGEDSDLSYLQKPFSSQVLVRRVRQLLQATVLDD